MKALSKLEVLAADPEVKNALRIIPRDEGPLENSTSERRKMKPLEVQVKELEREVELLERLRLLRKRRQKLKYEAAGPQTRHPHFLRAIAIAREVAQAFSFTLDDLQSRLRTREICEVRFEYFRRAHAAGLSLYVIGAAVCRNHGTVSSGLTCHPEGTR